MKESNNYLFIPSAYIPRKLQYSYWKLLHDYNVPGRKHRLIDRFPFTPDLTPEEATTYSTSRPYDTIFVLNQDMSILGEFSLDPFTPQAALFHFSSNPSHDITFPQMKDIFTKFVNLLLHTSPYKILLGITPIHNKRAIFTALRIGFKKVAEIPDICYYRGRVCKGVITYFTIKVDKILSKVKANESK